MIRERTTNMNANDTSLWEDLFIGLGAFLLVVVGIIAALLPIQLLANLFGVGAGI